MTKVKVVAAIEANHGGDLDVAKEMIKRSRDAHADYCKFQYLLPASQLGLTGEKAKQVRQTALNLTELEELRKYTVQQGLGWLVTPMKSIKTLLAYVKRFKPTIIKIREADGRNEEFVNAAVKTGATLLISVDPKKGPYFKPCENSHLLYCISKYPPRTADFSHRWAGQFEGFSSHFPHVSFCKISVREARAAGQPVYYLEAHVTLAHDYPCLDRKVSVDFDELAQITSYAHRER